MVDLKNTKAARVNSVQSCPKNNGWHYKIDRIRLLEKRYYFPLKIAIGL